jgi:ectoine hydroxylase-related dioxygenase (phytanoyl-CoA dioxygenase family)
MHVVPPSALTTNFALPGTMSMEDVAALLHTVQALPASPGTVLLWEPTTVHWGGPRTDRDAPERWALSLEFQRADMAATTQVIHPGTLPDFSTRRRAVGASLEVYAAPEREPLASRFVGLCEALLH